MGSSTSTCPDPRNLTCRPGDNLTLRKQIEYECKIHMIILVVVALVTGCLLVITVRIIDRHWCNPPRNTHQRIAQRRLSQSDHYITSMVGGVVSTRTHIQGQNPV